jgi:hypothetical protein
MVASSIGSEHHEGVIRVVPETDEIVSFASRETSI